MHEHDYVSPISARVLALQLELSCRLESHGAWAASLWSDAQVEGVDYSDHACATRLKNSRHGPGFGYRRHPAHGQFAGCRAMPCSRVHGD